MSTQSDPFLPPAQWQAVSHSTVLPAPEPPVIVPSRVVVTAPAELHDATKTHSDSLALQAPAKGATRVRSAVVPYQRAKVINVWNVPFDQVTMDSALDGIASMIAERTPRYVITANLNYAMLAAEDPSLGPITDGASMILADGQPIVWRSLLGGVEDRLPCRVAGSEMIFRLAERAAERGWRIYFLGAEPGVAQACADNLVARYAGMIVAGVQSPPYRKLSPAEVEQQFADIRAAKPDILLVAFGQPKGEKWIAEHYQSLGVPVSIQVGASFDFAAGRVERAPLWVQKIGFEWAHRMLGDPKRLLPRYYRNLKFLAEKLTREWIDFADQRFGEHPPAQTDTPLVDRPKRSQ
jgi:N-acetylglucosaminyldiphosphoundecaprenol N-acetyl-beta-D-mannosaminyltransferase